MTWLPTAIAIGVGIVTLLTFFFRLPLLDALGAAFREWTIVLTAFAVLLGLINLLAVHFKRIARRNESGAGYSLIVIVTALIVLGIGLLLPSEMLTWVFENMYLPLQGAFFALVAFFLATAAYRALRARSVETTVMLLAAVIVLLGQTPFTSFLAQAKQWVLFVPSEAGVRGILLGVALGVIATGLRLLLGQDRPYSE